MDRLTTWYVVADGGRARILQKRRKHGERPQAFDTLKEFVSDDLHRATHDLGAERPGRTRESAGSARHAVQPRQDLHQADKQNFVHEVAAALNAANARDEFDALVLVAPAHALGDLRQALDASTQRKITAQLQKDLTKVPNADLAEHFADLSGP
jgi:protein required for attachment to host cells